MDEVWRNVSGYRNKYEVSNTGKVFSYRTNNIMNPGVRGREWRKEPVIRLFKNNKGMAKSIGRLVAETFIPNPDSLPEVNHKDKDPFNNNINNLEWVTSSENSRHRNKDLGKRGAYKRSSGKWRAVIRQNRVNTHLGTFKNKEDAYEAYRLDYIKRYNEEPW